jgi:hypothetical protein
MDEDEVKPAYSEPELNAALKSSIGGSQGSVALGSILEGALRSSLTDAVLAQILTAALLPQPAGAIDPEIERTLRQVAREAIGTEQLLGLQQDSRHWGD